MEYIDSHAHIYAKKFDADRDEVISRCRENGVGKIYMPNIDVGSIEPMLEAAQKYPETCVPMMGLHPCDVDREFEKTLYVMEEWFNKMSFAGVGETGIDLYWDKTTLALQIEALKIQIGWAKEKNLPIILHCRESLSETIEIIRTETDETLTGIFHCFTGTLEQAQEIIEMGFLLGIGGVATFKNGGLDKVLPTIGLDHVVLETDSPYLAPVPYRGKRNSPEYIPLIAQRVSELTGNSLEEVAEKTSLNARAVFKNI